MTPVTQALSAAIIHFVWQGSIVGALLWIALLAMRNRSANLRYLVSCVGLAVMAALPIVTAATTYVRSAQTDPTVQAVANFSNAIASGWTGVRPNGFTALGWLESWTLSLWSAGVLLFSIRLAWGCRRAQFLSRAGEAADSDVLSMAADLVSRMGVDRPVRVLISKLAESPSVIGWLRPVILLPASTILGLTPEQLETVLAHELAHIRRRDYLVNILQMIVETLLFYHPAVWWTSGRIRFERELCCDDIAVTSCGNALSYARALTSLERLRLGSPRIIPTALAASGGPLLYRIRRLTGASSEGYGSSRLSAVLAVCLALTCVILNVNRIRGQESRTAVHEEPQEQVLGNDSPGVRVDLHSANIIHRGEVNYPEAALKRGIEGTIEIEATLDQTGNVSDARVLSGPDELRKSALQSVLEWHFMRNAGPSRLVSITFDKVAAQAAMTERVLGETAKVHYLGEVHKRLVGPKKLFFTEQFLFEQLKNDPKVMEEFQPVERSAYEALKTDEERRQFLMDFWRRRSPAELEKIPPLVAYTLEHPPAEEGKVFIGEAVKAGAILKGKLIEAEAEAGPLPGRTVKSIVFTGLSNVVKSDLQSRLPIHIGDVLSESAIEATSKAVNAYDEHLEISFLPNVDGQAEVRIGVAGSF